MKRFFLSCLVGTVATASLIAGCASESNGGGPASPAAAPASAVCATFYEDAHLKGATLVSTGPTDNSATIPASFNDKMSSVAVTPGCTVIAYADGSYGGQAATFTQTTEEVPASINDQMSSYKCTCGASAK